MGGAAVDLLVFVFEIRVRELRLLDLDAKELGVGIRWTQDTAQDAVGLATITGRLCLVISSSS